MIMNNFKMIMNLLKLQKIMHHAITFARADVVQWLLKKGADPHNKSIKLV